MAFSAAQKKEYWEKKNAHIEEVKERLASKVEDLSSSDEWFAFLKGMANFHNYSFRNQILIWIQRPDATRVASYATWKKVGRQVLKGEKGIEILTPAPYKKKDASGEVIVDDKGNEVKGLGFKTGNVFDISQTEVVDDQTWGRTEMTNIVRILSQDVSENGLLTGLVEVAKSFGFSMVFDDLKGVSKDTNGYTTNDGKTNEIHVRESLPVAQKVKTSFHELGHSLMHVDEEGNEFSAGGRAHRGIAEVEAESVAYICCDLVGIASDEYSVGYVAGWAGGDAELVRQTGESIQKSVKKIMSKLDDIFGVVEVEDEEDGEQ